MLHLAESGGSSLLYIVLGVIYVLYNIYSGIKKNQKEKSQMPLPDVLSDDNEDDYDNYSDRKNYEYNAKKESISKAFYRDKSRSKNVTLKQFKEPIDGSISKTNRGFLDEDLSQAEEVKIAGVNAKSAIIASEILRRPEY